jgi:hypothetical protein
MVCIGVGIAIPSKRDEKAWAAIRKMLGERRRANEQREFEELVRRKHDLEQQIERLKSLPANLGRTKTIRQLRKELNAL